MGPYTLIPALPFQLHNAVTTGTGGVLYLRGEVARVTFVLQSTGTTSAGAITLEEAYFNKDVDPVYSGTWSAITTAINASSFTGGAQSVVHAAGSFWAVRARISSDITGGGTVSVWAWGN